jgi:uncharacterized protein YjhX (UPF0386 family)
METLIEINELRDFIKKQKCPFCSDKRIFRSLSSHTTKMHGISAYELREMAGLNRYTSICSPDYSLERRENVLSRPKEILLKQLAGGHKPEIIKNRDLSFRQEGKQNRDNWLFSDRHLALAKEKLHTKEAIEKIGITARNRSPEIVKAQTKRVIEANAKWLQKATPEEIESRNKKRYKTWEARLGGRDAVIDRMKQMSGIVPYEVKLKACRTAQEVLSIKRKDPEWKEKWRANIIKSKSKKSKIQHSDLSSIKERVSTGKTTVKEEAKNYKVTARYIRRVVSGK